MNSTRLLKSNSDRQINKICVGAYFEGSIVSIYLTQHNRDGVICLICKTSSLETQFRLSTLEIRYLGRNRN